MTVRTFDEPGDLDAEPYRPPTRFESFDQPAPTPKKATVLDQLVGELSKPSEAVKEITRKVPARPSISVRYNTDIDIAQLDKWREKATKNKKSGEINVLLMNQLMLTSQCLGILFNGEEAYGADGKPLTFMSDEILSSLNALDTNGAIKVLYDRDSDILKIGGEILKAAGYDMDDTEDESDPLD